MCHIPGESEMRSKQQLLELMAATESDRSKYLSGLFEFVPDMVVEEMRYEEIESGRYILHAGTPSDTVYIILSGKIMGVDRQKMGRVYYFMDFAKMYIIGDFEIFADIPEYCVSIRAAKDCKLLKISAKSYMNWIRHDKNALFLRMKNIMATLTSERMVDREYIFMSCKERLVDYLVKSFENGQKDSQGRHRVPKTQAELADRIGYNVRSIQRSIAALEKEKLISNENGKIMLTQEQVLQLKQYKE